MAGKAQAPLNGDQFRDQVAELAGDLDLLVDKEVEMGRRLWGAKRQIDLVLTDPKSRRRLGIECKWQGSRGSVEEKIPATISDIESWPIDGIVAYDGPGFSTNMRAYLDSTGKAIEFPHLEAWLRLYFGLELTR